MHGVAFDAKLVGANVDKFSRGWVSKSSAQQALHDFAKLNHQNQVEEKVIILLRLI